MANIKTISITGFAADVDNISVAQTTGGAANLTITGDLATAGVATLVPPGQVSFASTGNIATVVFTITGTDRYDNAQTATVTGINNSTVATTVDFKTVTQVATSATVGTNVTVGTNAVASTPWYCGDYKHDSLVGIFVTLSAGASLTYTVETTPTNLNDQALLIGAQITQAQNAIIFPSSDASVVAASTNQISNFISSPPGIRLTLNSWVSGTATLNIIIGNTHTT